LEVEHVPVACPNQRLHDLHEDFFPKAAHEKPEEPQAAEKLDKLGCTRFLVSLLEDRDSVGLLAKFCYEVSQWVEGFPTYVPEAVVSGCVKCGCVIWMGVMANVGASATSLSKSGPGSSFLRYLVA
jgi:hypothetical protein